MLRNYIKTTLRTLKKNKAYAFINIIGLALGIGCSLVIFKVIMFELSYDDHHENRNDIYRISRESIYPDHVEKGMGTPHPLGPAIKADYPEIKEVVRTYFIGGGQINVTGDHGELKKFLIDDGIGFTENAFFKIFTTEWIVGDKETALTEPNTVVLTQSAVRQLFGLKEGEEIEAMGKLVNNEVDFKVVGIIKDFPESTILPFTMLFEYDGQKESNPYYWEGKEWGSTSSATNTYILTESGFDPLSFEEKLIGFVEKYFSKEESQRRRCILQNFSGLHFDREYGTYNNSIPFSLIYALGIIALFLVLTACINFINLATAQAANRAKEIGIRKAIGVKTGQLIAQFMSEISLITFISMIVALAIAEILFISLEDLLGYRLFLDFANDPASVVFLVTCFLLVSIISGLYPSLLLSRMNAILALKSKITSQKNSGGLSLRKGLVVFQFAISQFLIVGTLIVTAQMKYFQEKDLGFDSEAIINSYLPDQDEVKRDRFRSLLLESPSISDITFALSQPTGESNSNSSFNYAPMESENNYRATFKVCDEYYFDFFDLELLAGRSLRKTDTFQIVINRRIADLIGFKNNYDSAVGKMLHTGWDGDKKIVGVMENFHSQSLGDEIEFALLIYIPRVFYSLSFKVGSMTNMEEGLEHFKKTWEEVYPKYVIDYTFYDEQLGEMYEMEQSIASLLKIFALISIFIGCLGLFGLISFIAINRKKEISVRKVLGASVFTILKVFSKEMFILITIAFCCSAPFAYFLMNKWLEGYIYRIELGYEFFALSFLITLAIAALTISHRAISTALINPAKTLKDE